MSSSYNGLRIKQKSSIPATAGTGESVLWVNSSDSNNLYLNGLAVSATTVTNPTVDPDFTGWTQSDQVGDGYTSSKQLSFNTSCLKQVSSGNTTTLELADTVTKDLIFKPDTTNLHRTDNVLCVTDVYQNCLTQYQGIKADESESYSMTIGGFSHLLGDGIMIDCGYSLASDGLSRPVFNVTATPADRHVIIGDNGNGNNYIKFDCEHPNGGTFEIFRNGDKVIYFDGLRLNVDGIPMSFGDVSGGNFVEISSGGSLNGYVGGELGYYILPNGTTSFGVGQNNTMTFNTTNNTGDIFSVTQNTISKVAKITAETVNGIADLAFRANNHLGMLYQEYNSKSLLQYIIDEVYDEYFSS